ncbi:hypothetical protein EJ066_26230 [Mesorhizobium sp. M9A.F.Ca.ET.002.03.1.2]|uniref:hypothetical protein n=1 Tax=Mesorhizobium sp. M9A.F.Ca.ET.002.03.1.2 TaxID=2493668 RepID=UPI000F74F042|nr:hypothetical protein [Mesorhizobium sp. M9A.F.Ca.ET.002.03.1.2]AZO00341.1 hypothetical protein EJ066_26230 [Mesorhizobium sp. M9A.F.Ca.ET.002.03.1.2]
MKETALELIVPGEALRDESITIETSDPAAGWRREHTMRMVDQLPGCSGVVARVDLDNGLVLFVSGLYLIEDEKPSHHERRLRRMHREFRAWKRRHGVEDVNFNVSVH